MTDANAGPPGHPGHPGPSGPGAAAAPSGRRLLGSTLIAAAAAIVILFTAVLPAEYGVDPTGVGSVLGLTEMGKIKRALAAEAAAAEAAASPGAAVQAAQAAAPSAAVVAAPHADTARITTITLQPGQSREIKLAMRQGARVDYSWSTDGGVVNHSTHGDTLNAPPGVYHEYRRGTGVRADSGALVAVFTGMHGWFWRNRTRAPVTITLRTRGAYGDLREVR